MTCRSWRGCSPVSGSPAAQPPQLRPELRGYYVREGAFEFNPARHDFGPKTLAGSRR